MFILSLELKKVNDDIKPNLKYKTHENINKYKIKNKQKISEKYKLNKIKLKNTLLSFILLK